MLSVNPPLALSSNLLPCDPLYSIVQGDHSFGGSPQTQLCPNLAGCCPGCVSPPVTPSPHPKSPLGHLAAMVATFSIQAMICPPKVLP